ncbi:hypothetical protein ACFSTH_08180 [Paenibacillus yanchengensis]|uniref:Uncharacterized protein n=1 Tax=Paenibacillus yanchengensis TaxID=2035833 RepID=A0ABW4YKW9_9BACL
MARSNYEGAINLNKYSIEIKRLMDQAAADGASKQVIQEVTRILGAHAAQQAKSPEEVPTMLRDILEQASKGITAGMLMYHGRHGVMDIHMMQVKG